MNLLGAAPAAPSPPRKAKALMGTLSSDILGGANDLAVASLNIAPTLIYGDRLWDVPTDIPSAFVGSVDVVFRNALGLPLP